MFCVGSCVCDCFGACMCEYALLLVLLLRLFSLLRLIYVTCVFLLHGVVCVFRCCCRACVCVCLVCFMIGVVANVVFVFVLVIVF